jgi:hypothetical protein
VGGSICQKQTLITFSILIKKDDLMKKNSYRTIVTLMMLLLLSCQEAVSQTTPQLINTPTKLPPFSTSSEIVTPTLTPLTESTLNIFSVNINFIPELSGDLYLNPNGVGGPYFDIDFGHNRVVQNQTPDDCQLLSTGQKAVCEVKVDSGGIEVFVYDISTKQQDSFLGQTLVYRWGISGSQRYIIYILNEPEEGGMPIYSYDIATKKNEKIGIFKDFHEILFPLDLPSSNKFLIAVDAEESGSITQPWYQIDLETMKVESVKIPDNIQGADPINHSVEWAPDDKLIAFIGYFDTDEPAEISLYQCRRVTLVYDPVTKTVISTIKAPENHCFAPFWPNRFTAWSPDGSRLVFILDQKDSERQQICIADIVRPESICVSMTTTFQMEGYTIQGLTWSPGSNYIAFCGNNYNFTNKVKPEAKLEVFSLVNNQTYLITEDDALLFGCSYLVWR